MYISEMYCISHHEATTIICIRKPLFIEAYPVFINLNKVSKIEIKHGNYIYLCRGKNYRSK